MESQENKTTELDAAKHQLRESLSRLESVVEQKILSSNDNDSNNVADDNLIAESQHLREENSKMHAELGQMIEENKNLSKKNRNATARIDNIISQLQAALTE